MLNLEQNDMNDNVEKLSKFLTQTKNHIPPPFKVKWLLPNMVSQIRFGYKLDFCFQTNLKLVSLIDNIVNKLTSK